jgi:amino acid adenylation domain-containing protein
MVSKGGSDKLGLSEQGQELLGLLLEEEGFRLSRPLTITPRQDDGPPPLSFAQERTWFLCQFDPESVYYNIPMALLCAGRLDVAALEKSLSTILARHEVLRAVFQNVGGQPVQHFLSPKSISLPPVDLRDLPPSEREARTQQLIIEEARQPFDLEQGPLLRAQLLRLDDREHILLVTVHHIVADGISYSVLMRELQALYTAFVAGEALPLADLPFQFADFAHWQQQWLQGDVLGQKLDYWRQRLEGIPTALALATDHPRPPVQTYWGARHSCILSKETTGSLKALSKKQGVSLFVTLLTAWGVLLYRYTDQEDIVVGSPIANRNFPGIQDLIGLFINTLVLRVDLSGDPSLAKLARRASQIVLEAYEHQDLPFEKLVEALQPRRDTSRTPFFQVMFNFQSSLVFNLDLPDLNIRLLEQPTGIAKFDLTLDISEVDEELRVAIEYNTDLFEASTAERMLGHFQTLLRGIIDDPERPISVLPLLTPEEQHCLLVEWNNTGADYLAGRCVHELFEAQVARSPDALALVFENEKLTYRELNQRANQLAHHLQKLGVGPDTLVGICVERSLGMVIGLLGVLKAGGAYVPLDPTYPPERLAFIRQDAQLALLLTQARLVESLGESETRTLCLDGDWAPVSRQSEENPVSQATADNLAYVIYTSGSTGRPKGVAIAHRSTVAMLDWSREVFPAADRAGVLASTSICFDLSVFELFVPLSWGGRVILSENALQLPGLAAVQEVALVNTVPSAMAELVRLEGLPPSVRTVNLAGEPLPRQLVDQLYQHDHIECVFNLYGPSEDTTYSTFALIQKDSQRTPAIGRPVTHSQMYLLNGQGALAPPGVPGELYIGGEGLARGYLARPELTAERFLPDSFGGKSGGRLYKTGDLARYLPDGQLEFLGRIDHQVKIRGFRIEPGEIEAALSQHPDVHETAVVAREDVPGDKRLIAYIVPNGKPPTFSAMRNFLRKKLPEHMIPAAFIMLEQIPLTPNGKVDRQALPTPGKTQAESETGLVTPRNPVEEKLAEIWADILQRERIGIHDNFFELGGHSLLATRVVSQVQATFQVLLPLHILFEMPSVADIAQEIVRRQAEQSGQSIEGDQRISRVERDEEGELLADHLDQLSDAEIDSLLEQMLWGSENG